jgi:hypothetical protein
MAESSALVEYRGNCHCGAFRFTFKTSELREAMVCKCSICTKVCPPFCLAHCMFTVSTQNGYMWWWTANEENFVVIKGDENTTLKTYVFGKRSTLHKVGFSASFPH